MKITYIGHSGFLVELETVTFIFDYYVTETDINGGNFPEFNRDNALFVFASHSHGDHYNPDIFTMFGDVKKVTYVLSYDIKPKISAAASNYIFLKANAEYTLSDGIAVQTFKSTDKGVAFLIDCAGKLIYHAGDLNWWAWEDDTKQEANDMKARYTREIAKLRDAVAERAIDAAFLPLDSRQENLFYLGFDYAMRQVEIKTAFPMHTSDDFSVVDRLKEMEISAPYRDKIINIKREKVYEL